MFEHNDGERKYYPGWGSVRVYMKCRLLLAGILLLFLSQGFGQEQSTQGRIPTSSQSTFNERYPRYLVGPGDIFDITFEFSPEFNQTATVQPDGFVTLREVGDVHVSGSTIPQFTTVAGSQRSRNTHTSYCSDECLQSGRKPKYLILRKCLNREILVRTSLFGPETWFSSHRTLSPRYLVSYRTAA